MLVRSISLIVATDLRLRGDPQALVGQTIRQGGVDAGGRACAEGSVESSEAKLGEGDRRHRIIGAERGLREQRGSAEGERAVTRIANADEALPVIPLAGASGIEGCPLVGETKEVVVSQRLRTIDQVQRERVEAGFRDADDLPPIGDWLRQT